jgi:hypothetical protein
MKGLVLAGGKGTRLRPLTYTLPKQLIPVANRPVVHYVLGHLAEAGIRDVGVIVAPETAEQIRAALSANPWGCEFTFLVQDEPRGLAHTILVARDFLGDSPFVMYLGDNLLGAGLGPLLRTFAEQEADAVILLKDVSDPRQFGVAEMDGGGRLRRLVTGPGAPVLPLAAASDGAPGGGVRGRFPPSGREGPRGRAREEGPGDRAMPAGRQGDLRGAEVLIPKAVWEEVVAEGEGQLGAQEIKASKWIKIEEVKDRSMVRLLHI